MKKLLFIIGWLICSQGYCQFIVNNGIAIKNSALLVTNGDWTNTPGSLVLNNGEIRTSESFVNNGTLDAASTGGFILNYSSDKNFQPGGSSLAFLSKNGAGNALVSGTISIRDSLILRNGLVRLLNATDTVTLRENAFVAPLNNSYIEGMVARLGSGNLLFPIGRDGLYLPIIMNRVVAKKLTASVELAPAGHTAGPGVDALIAFPYAWRVREQLDTDTAAYVELNYPNTLPVVTNPIVVRQVPGAKFASMGARFISNAARVTVRSYSRGTKGLFTIAQGFASDFKTDSLALVALYNATGGLKASTAGGWLNRTGWTTAPVANWAGVTVTGQSITAVSLPNNQLSGTVPDALVDILSLQNVNLSGNGLTSVPAFTVNPQILSLNVANNKLTFASLEPNAFVPGFSYLTQGVYGTARDESVAVGSAVTFNASAGGTSTVYKWVRDGKIIPSITGAVYNVPAISRSTMGEHVVEATNALLPGLTLKSAPLKVLAHADMSGKIYVSETQPATAGEVVLYKVTDTKFDIVETKPIGADGSYTFLDKTLDDYQISGFADTLVHARALPTYYQGTIFWEEADTVFLENNVDNLNIRSSFEPLPASGRGLISGNIQEDIPEGGRIKRATPVKQAGVSARRVQNTGRGQEEILTLVAYVFSDENGEFTLPNLPTGTYRLNIQYPGYPMDETSDITLVIGEGLQSQISVDAKVIDGKITVKKLVITGLFDAEKFQVRLFPNPAADIINLHFDEEVKGRTIDLTSMAGRKVLNTNAEQKEARINIQHLESGIYLLRIKQEGISVKTLKVVIE